MIQLRPIGYLLPDCRRVNMPSVMTFIPHFVSLSDVCETNFISPIIVLTIHGFHIDIMIHDFVSPCLLIVITDKSIIGDIAHLVLTYIIFRYSMNLSYLISADFPVTRIPYIIETAMSMFLQIDLIFDPAPASWI